ncbi:gas vesicle protein GvpO [Patescibacteria group bacterium]
MAEVTKKIIQEVNPKELIEKAKKELADLTGFSSPSGIGFKKDGAEWVVIVEIIEKKSIPEGMDVIGTYEIRLDAKRDLLGYKKVAMRKKMDTEIFEIKE